MPNSCQFWDIHVFPYYVSRSGASSMSSDLKNMSGKNIYFHELFFFSKND